MSKASLLLKHAYWKCVYSSISASENHKNWGKIELSAHGTEIRGCCWCSLPWIDIKERQSNDATVFLVSSSCLEGQEEARRRTVPLEALSFLRSAREKALWMVVDSCVSDDYEVADNQVILWKLQSASKLLQPLGTWLLLLRFWKHHHHRLWLRQWWRGQGQKNQR